ncbi:MAG TPA: sulfate adenylyltransferase subunit CysN [Chromatiales bacterium]|nr:sulfate adenylyltransferase subunit CysN [Chromatiales bacterium]
MSIAKQDIELLRLVTVGSVDDGKSTLMGRLLYDTKGAFEDQLQAVRKDEGEGADGIDLAQLTDGLAAEREQGITIDVAYRYFATPRRKFIMADCPGHEQYTRNMVTGASTANAAVILIDARKGVLQQTRRHTHIISLLGLPHLIVAINKMDLIDYDEATFLQIKEELSEFCARQNIHDLICIPVSALAGDMVVERGNNMPWYEGKTVLETLETIDVSGHLDENEFRFPVQYVSRPQTKELPDFRGFMGRIASGTVKPGDEIMQLPAGKRSKIKEIITFDGNLDEAFAPQSVTLTLEDEIDISRGDIIVHADKPPHTAKELEAIVCWMGEEPLSPHKKYLIKHTTNTVKAMVSDIQYRTDINELTQDESANELAMNEIGKVSLKLMKPLTFDRFEDNRATGNFIIIDSFTNNTVGAAMIC